MLADAIVRLLAAMGMHVVVDLNALEGRTTARYDAAITTGSLPGLESDLVIELATPAGADAAAWVQRGTGRYRVPVGGLADVLDLLRAFCPADAVRAPARGPGTPPPPRR
jgi:hypothetical protein